MNIVFWFDFGFTILIVGCGYLFELFPITLSNIIFNSCLILVNVVFYVWLKRISNPVYLFSYCMVVCITTSVKLLYGYLIFSKAELIKDGYPLFGWPYIVVVILLFALLIYMYIKFYKVYRDLTRDSAEEVVSKISMGNQKSKFVRIAVILGACSPYLLIHLSDDALENMGLGIGFMLWCLACIWLWLAAIFIPKYIVAKKYNAAGWFESKKTD